MKATIRPTDSSSEDSAVYQPLLGLEIEMPVANATTGQSQPASAYFPALAASKTALGIAYERTQLHGRCVALQTDTAEYGLDNGFNLLETALSPIAGGPGGLSRLAVAAHQALADSIEALQADGACVLNVSQHPACGRDDPWYGKVCVPRPIYRELREHRGWHHWAGIDAKAQNGPNTSIPISEAISALNVAIALAPASIALFANSPLEDGRVTGLKETRMTLWPRVFGPARFAGDFMLCRYPQRPFRDMADFFGWMFGPATVSRGLPVSASRDYKSVATVLLENHPSLTTFLKASSWGGQHSEDGRALRLTPTAAHFEYSQIAQFLDARLRYRWQALPSLAELLAAWEQEGGLESLFARCHAKVYIEARAPGAGFADQALLQEAGADAARSLLIAPSAVQAGLLQNRSQATALVEDWGWERLGVLRERAIHKGLADDEVLALSADVLSVARAGLAGPDLSWLSYAEYALQVRRSGADRLIETWNRAGDSIEEKLKAVVLAHTALPPQDYGALPVQGSESFSVS